jgi:hypothetical protein
LTNGAASYQHREVDYAEIETNATTPGVTFSVTWAPDGQKATITGHCPECYGPTKTEFNTGIPDTRFRGPKKIPTLPSPVTLYCECGHTHKDRPADARDRGCGRYWLLYVAAAERVHPRYLS